MAIHICKPTGGRTIGDYCMAALCPANIFVMLTLNEVEKIQNAANLTVNLIHFYIDKKGDLLQQLKLVYALLAEMDSLGEEEQLLVQKIYLIVFPGAKLEQGVDCGVLQRDLPEHMCVQEVINYLEISRSTFYKEVPGKLLSPVKKIGNRSYYLKEDVMMLMVKHEKGAWTYSKLAKEKEEHQAENTKQPER